MTTAVYTAGLVGIEIVAEGKAALIERLQADYDTLAPMLMELAKVSKIGRELLDIIAAAECRIAIALAVVEGDGGPDDPPDGDDAFAGKAEGELQPWRCASVFRRLMT